MRATGFLLVAGIFVAVALLAHAINRAIGWAGIDSALVVAAIVASQAGTFVWHRQAPASAERSVKRGLGVVLSVTAVVFTLILHVISGWPVYPEVTIPIVAVGCFMFPFVVVGSLWKALSKGKPPEHPNAAQGTSLGGLTSPTHDGKATR